MIFGQDRDEIRRMYVNAWRKRVNGEPMSALEQQIADVIGDHPEYQDLMQDDLVEADYTPEGGATNPFLHMGLHLAVREQVATDRPPGVATVYAALKARSGDAHEAEHKAIDCLAETLWEAQSRNTMPDEQAYLERLRKI